LRFPRVLKIRYDKGIEDALKYEEFLKFYENLQHNNITREKRKVEDLLPDEMADFDKKRKKVDKYTKILESFRDTDTNNVNKISDLFNGNEFLILNIDENLSKNIEQKKILECIIVENGGNKVQNFLQSTTHIIASKLDIRAQNLLKSNDVNIYNPKWITDTVKYNKHMKLSPLYLTHINKATAEKFSYRMDKYNDDYYDYVTSDTLIEIFNSMGHIKINSFAEIIKDLKKEYGDKFNLLN
jgi:hypothetical protein